MFVFLSLPKYSQLLILEVNAVSLNFFFQQHRLYLELLSLHGPSGYRDSSFARVNYERKENVPAVYLYHIYVHEQNTRISRIIPECIVGGHSGGGEGGGEEIRF